MPASELSRDVPAAELVAQTIATYDAVRLVSPEDANHLQEARRILSRLQFHAFNDRFDCTREELVRLGKRADSAITEDGPALRHGATQFKVNFAQLRKVFHQSHWARKNTLITLPSSPTAGPS